MGASGSSLLSVIVLLIVSFVGLNPAHAQQSSGVQLRVLDKSGLIRAARVVHEVGNVKVATDGGAKGECVASNLDGLANEQRSAISPSGECVFQRLQSGSWQLEVPGGPRWRVQIYE
jgi:hypothetical protein